MRFTFSLMAWLAGVGCVLAADWPQWLGPQRDGVWREEGILELLPKEGLKAKWRQKLGVGYSGPAVADGRVFVMDLVPEDNLPASGFAKGARVRGRERVVCLRSADGTPLWTFEYPVEYRISYAAGPRCTPSVDGERVYALGAMGHLHCLDVASGKVLWSKDFLKDYQATLPVWGFAAHPLVDGNRLICLAGGSDQRLVIAFDKRTGEAIWTAESCAGDFGYSPPVIYTFGNRRQLIIWHARAVVGLEPESGRRLWRVDWDIRAALTAPMPRKIEPDKLFLTSFYNGSMLLRVGTDQAEVLWRSKAKGEMPHQTTDLSSIMPTPVVDGDYIYGVCSYGQLRCLEWSTGKRVWSTMRATRGRYTPARVAEEEEPATSERWSNAFLTPHGDRCFLLNEQGELILARLRPQGYEELGRCVLVEPTNTMAGRKVVWSHPAYAERCIFVRNDQEIACFSLAR